MSYAITLALVVGAISALLTLDRWLARRRGREFDRRIRIVRESAERSCELRKAIHEYCESAKKAGVMQS